MSFNFQREKMRKRGVQLKKGGAPREGIWYWVLLSSDWKLLTWDSPVREKRDFLHVEVWPAIVRSHLVSHYGLSPSEARRATELPYAFPRGRISSESEGKLHYFFVRHGNDTPVPDGLRQVEGRFNLVRHLLEGLAEEIRDRHETMDRTQNEEMTQLIGTKF
jgi:hypothetical protein